MKQPQSKHPGKPPRRVLIADDSDRVRDSLRRMIACFSHLTVVGEAQNGTQALEMIRQLQPEVVVLDLEMPEMTGLEVLETLKGEALNCTIIMFTGQTEEVYRQKCLDLGAKYFFQKATQLDRFVAVLKEL